MEKVAELKKIGQFLWYDNIQRDLLKDGTIQKLIDAGMISGITSNPSIFKKAILSSVRYQFSLKTMAWAGWTAAAIYEQLAVEDIREAADLLLACYTKTNGQDGYISLEVDPELANDTQATIADAQRLWKMVDRPNLMVKIPATEAGIPAIRASIAAGINVNVTLIFSVKRYQAVIEAFLSGLEDRVNQGLPVQGIASVASFFVSRFDTKIDAKLETLQAQEGQDLFGKAAIANAKLAYREYQTAFSNSRFQSLKKKGAQIQRPLWASTSTKNPAYRDVLYVEELIGPDTVNTVPPATLDAFFEHGVVRDRLSVPSSAEDNIVQKLAAQGIDLEQIAQELEVEGVQQFQDAFREMVQALDEQRKAYAAELGSLQAVVKDRIASFEKSGFSASVFQKDASLWTESVEGQQEVAKRLGWLEAPRMGISLVSTIQKIVQDLIKDGFSRAVLIGMGGSSLAAEVMAFILGKQANGLELRILDSTDPAQVLHTVQWAEETKTVFLVSSKSGTTVEINSAFQYAWERVTTLGSKNPGEHFIAITDPGTALQNLAEEHHFRAVFLADPNVGGRYSALTAFGLVPAGLLGVSLPAFLKAAQEMRCACDPTIPAGRNPGLVLGAILGEAYLQGKDKLTILTDAKWSSFGSWVEQLIAESSGKEGKGILPIDQEPVIPVEMYPIDRVFVYLRQDGREDQRVQEIRAAGHPCLVMAVNGEYALAEQFYQWEFATATACTILRVNAFDQPNVQDSKTRTKQKVKIIEETGQFAQEKPLWEGQDFQVFSKTKLDIKDTNLKNILNQFLEGDSPTDYVAINAFLERDEAHQTILQAFRKYISDKYHLATTLGYGPRFLHSTGQLHKGGKNNGYFIVLSLTAKEDIHIPGQTISFQQMLLAQTLGDIEALETAGRKVLYIHFKDADLQKLTADFN
ncbi:MAG: bifunctional transaldolase/phosoglucose isomerase [Anaerolineaceae bacterium]